MAKNVSLLALACLILFGCDGHSASPQAEGAIAEQPVIQQYPIVAGDIEVTVGDGREIIAPPGSATAGSRWIEHPVTYTNKSDHPIWIVGYSETRPFAGIETRTSKNVDWHDYGLGYCGTGALEIEIAPNTSYSFTAALPEKYIGQEFRVMFPYRTERGSQRWIRAVSQDHKLGRPTAE